MKITEYSPVNKPSAAGKKKGVSSAAGDDFLGLLSVSETEETSSLPPAADIQSVTSMDTLLTLQEIPDNEMSKRQAIEDGKDALETLERLRLALLSGGISGNILSKLNEIANIRKQFINDSKLDSIIHDIELRAAVELAKLERASKE